MLRLVLLLIVVAGVAGYFTRPTEAVMSEAANAVLGESAETAAGQLDIGNVLESGAAGIAGDRLYSNYYVAAKYDITLDGTPVVSCIGAFTQVKCDRAPDTRTGG